jgi:signal peptide peptidase SppA
MFEGPQLWLGSEAGFGIVLSAYEQAVQMMVAGSRGYGDDEMSMLSVSDGVAVVSIKGPLISGNAGFMRYFGVTGYNDIRDALVQAVNDASVETILLDINSPGGSVAGVSDTSNFIRHVSALKPVVAYADGALASGAYWLGSTAKKIVITPTTVAGSIGVIRVHTEASHMRKEAGITDTVIRSGKYKALAGPYEPLSDVAKEQLQAQSDEIYQIFLGHVAAARGISVSVADSKLGQGREFIGQKAMDIGMVDKISNFEGAIALAKSLAPVDKKKGYGHNSRQVQGVNSMPKAHLSAEQIAAALECGANLDATSQTPEEIAAAAAAATEAARVAAEAQAAADAEAARVAAEAAAAAAAAAAPKDSELVTHLRTELKTAQEANVAAQVELAELRKQVATTAETQEALLKIGRNSVGKMSIALGGSADAAQTLGAAQIVTEHERLSALFAAKFKVGGVAASPVTDLEKKPEEKPTAKVSPLLRALVPLAKQSA